jgi:Peptidase family M28
MAFHLTNPMPLAYEPASTLRTGLFGNLIALLILAGVICFTAYRLNAPAAVSANVPPGAFSSGRAMVHVQNIAQKPHPMGSAEHAAVRDYIVKELTALGVKPEVQKATVVSESSDMPVIAGSVENIIARLNGSNNTKAVMLTGHYDSVPTGPGASDDSTAVASMLETLRALKAGPPLKNDVVFVFADGEEIALLGAQAIVDDPQSVPAIGLVLNFEARGSSGPSLMYETSEGNQRLIEEFAKAVPRPLANSLLFEIYKRLPNDTDFSVYKRAGLPGLNFAYVDQSTHYHTQLDNVGTVSENSLQHHGSYALALTRHFGNLDLPATSNGNAVYFDVLSLFVVRYPVSIVVPLTVLVVALFAAVIVLGFRRKRLTLSGIAFGFIALLLSMVGSGLAVSLVWRVGGLFQAEYRAMTYGEVYNSRLYLFAFVALTLAITSSLYLLFGRKRSVADLWMGALLWWLVFLLLTTFGLQGGTYLFTWPLLFSLFSLLILFIRKPEETRSRKQLAILLVGTIPAVVLFIPVIQIMFVGLTVSSSAMVMVVVALLLGLLVPHLNLISSMNKWLLPAASSGICVVFLISAVFTSHFDAINPKQDNVFYALQADTGQAVWASTSNRADNWTSQFFPSQAKINNLPDFFPGKSWRFLTSEAPATELTAPKIETLSEERSGAERTLRLRVTSTRQAAVISLYVDADAEVHGTHINGQVIKREVSGTKPAQGNKWELRYFAIPASGIELTLVSQSLQTIRIKAVDQSYELPSGSMATFKPRPDGVIPAPLPLSDSTLVSKSFTF